MPKNKDKAVNTVSLLELFTTFFKIGAFSFGGGYAMLPVIAREISEQRSWVKKEELQDVFAITGCLPGAIALNAAAFTGYITRGVGGMIIAVCGNLLPSVVVVIALCTAVALVRDNPVVEAAFLGIRPAVVALIAYAAFNMAKGSLKDGFAFTLCLVALAVAIFVPAVGVVPIVLLGGLAGLAGQKVKRMKLKGRSEA
ncbi:chromate transporter [Pelosinus propionicus DSM 13327]|uniref:Chromate transporter n=2 Tax=Pelosinus TaxID=365348 RepID=A0A1I4M3S9_9FIRM|nr:chromate transporter [Pelosinus propionicus DSM 13327]